LASKAGEEVVENVVEKTTGIDGNTVKTVKAVAETGAAVGAAASAATGLTVLQQLQEQELLLV
jgi:hypothetical protein